jgi:hypothetical protein
MEDYARSELSEEEINRMEIKRLESLSDAGIDEREVLHKAKQHKNAWNSYFNENVVRGKDDMNFCLRDQWTAIERSEFTRLFKPAMTFNKLYDAVKKIAGEQRKNKPDLMVRSLTGKATQEQIELRADLVRTISYQSQNDLVYQTAFKSALMMGYGAFQIDIDYESAKSFNQIIKFLLIPDSTHCAWDPSAIKPHKGDGNWCSRDHHFTKEEFYATYPYVINPVSYTDQRTLLDFQWETRDTIVVCDYYVKEWYSTEVYKLSNGETVTPAEWDEMQAEIKMKRKLAKDSPVVGAMILKDIPKITRRRQTQDYHIMHYRLIHNQIIDFTRWPSKYLPVIFVDGDSHYIEGRQYTKSFVHEARDAQKFINYVGSEIAAEIKNRRREQWIGTPDNIIGQEQMWRNPELQMGILLAKPDQKTGQMPTKMQPWELSPALMENFQRGGQDIKEILGFSESEEIQGRDISGKARRERKLEGSMSAYVFLSNLNQSLEQGGRVVLDLLPAIIGDDERHMVISKVDGEAKSTILNKRNEDGSIENELTAGDYDVEIDAGPSFSVQKEVALEMFQETMQVNPQVFPLIADLWAKNMDIQYMPQIAERFKTLVPPEILAKENGEPPPPPKPNPQEMMMQAELQEKQAKIQNEMKKIEVSNHKLDLDKERLELDRAKMLMEFKEVQIRTHQDERDHELDLKKIELEHRTKLTGIAADLHKHHNEGAKDKIAKNKPKPKAAKSKEKK